MTLKNAVTKGVKAWRDRRVGYWLCIDPKTGEYYLLTSAALAELNGLKAMYRLPAVYYRAVLTRDWKVKLGPHVIGTHLDTSAYIKDLDGFFTFGGGEGHGLQGVGTRLCVRGRQPPHVGGVLYCLRNRGDGVHIQFLLPFVSVAGEKRGGRNEYIRHCLSLFEPTGFYLDDVILGPAKQPTEGKVFGNVIEECLEAFFSACCEDVKYAESQEYFADFADNNELEFYENGICIRHR